MKSIEFLQNLDRSAWTKFARDSYLEGFFHDNPFRPLSIVITPMNERWKVKFFERTGENRAWVEMYFDAFNAKYVADSNNSLDTRSPQARFNSLVSQQWRAYIYRIICARNEKAAETYYEKLLRTAKSKKFSSDAERMKYIQDINSAIEWATTHDEIYSK